MRSAKAQQMILLGMAFGAFPQSEVPPIRKTHKIKNRKKETLPEWTVFRNVYFDSDTHIDLSENVPSSAFILFTCRALNKQNAKRKYLNYLKSK